MNKTSRKSEILVLGDSHADIFNHPICINLFPNSFFMVVSVPGATISGLQNPNSVTQALPIFEGHLKTSSAKTLLCLLGEVDVGFLIWYQAERYGFSVKEMTRLALDKYQSFLLNLKSYGKVICVSTPLPTISDHNDWGEVSNKRKEVRATQRERTDLTLSFNFEMQAYCAANNIIYIACDEDLLASNHLLRSDFLNSNPLDHHYNPTQFASLLASKLNQLL